MSWTEQPNTGTFTGLCDDPPICYKSSMWCVWCGDLRTYTLQVFCLDQRHCANSSPTLALPPVWNLLNCGGSCYLYLSSVMFEVFASSCFTVLLLLCGHRCQIWFIPSQPHVVSVQVYVVILWLFWLMGMKLKYFLCPFNDHSYNH